MGKNDNHYAGAPESHQMMVSTKMKLNQALELIFEAIMETSKQSQDLETMVKKTEEKQSKIAQALQEMIKQKVLE